MNIPNYSPSGKQAGLGASEPEELTGGFLPPESTRPVGGEPGTLLYVWQHIGWLKPATLFLALALAFGLGFLAGREAERASNNDDRFWIEQLPPEVRGQAPATSTSSAQPAAQPAVGAAPERGAEQPAAVGAVLPPAPGAFVASRSGTKFYFPWCATAQRIKEENKVWFATREEAVAAGYEPASNCKGL